MVPYKLLWCPARLIQDGGMLRGRFRLAFWERQKGLFFLHKDFAIHFQLGVFVGAAAAVKKALLAIVDS